jgi:hypothetical protein
MPMEAGDEMFEPGPFDAIDDDDLLAGDMLLNID